MFVWNLLLLYVYLYIKNYVYIQGASRLVEITAGGYFIGLCDHNVHINMYQDFELSQSYYCLKLRIEVNDS